jgi:hypothetical protein
MGRKYARGFAAVAGQDGDTWPEPRPQSAEQHELSRLEFAFCIDERGTAGNLEIEFVRDYFDCGESDTVSTRGCGYSACFHIYSSGGVGKS